MKSLKILFILVTCFTIISCSKKEDATSEQISVDNILGMWKVVDRFPSFTTDCEREEYVVFYADSTLFRDQCGNSTGTWTVVEGELQIDLGESGSALVGEKFECTFVDEKKIKIKSLSNSLVWVTYRKIE